MHNLLSPSLRVGSGLIGLLLVLAFLRSVLQVAVVNRQRADWLSRCVGWFIYSALARRAAKRQSYADVQDVLSWVLPLYILLLIVVWFGIVQAGFALLIWSSQAGARLRPISQRPLPLRPGCCHASHDPQLQAGWSAHRARSGSPAPPRRQATCSSRVAYITCSPSSSNGWGACRRGGEP